MENVLSTLSSAPFHTTGHFYSGPRTNRAPTKVSYVEFASADVARDVFEQLDGKTFHSLDRSSLKIRMAKTQLNLQRDWCLRKAGEIIKEQSRSSNIRVDFKSREVQIDGAIGFKQESGDISGSFRNAFAALRLP